MISALPAALVLVAIALRLAAIDIGTLHEDEGLFAAHGLHIARTGDVFLTAFPGTPPDKLPLLSWLVAISVTVFGDGPLAIRLPGLLAGGLAAGSLYLAGNRLAGPGAGALAALVYALSPFAIAYDGSVFTDPLAIGLGTAGLAAAVVGRPTLAGALVALAVGAKVFALAYAPLVLLVVALAMRWAGVGRFLLGWTPIMTGWILLELYRTQVGGAPGILELAAQHNPTLPVAPDLWAGRASGWLYYAQSLLVDVVPRLVVVAAVIGALVVSGRRLAGLLAAFVAGYVVLLVMVSFPIYDRYILYVLPVVALLAGLGLARARGGLTVASIALLVVGSLPGIGTALAGELPVGPRMRTPVYGGIDGLCSWVRANATGEVVWHHSVSWHFAYCLQGVETHALFFPDPALITGEGPMNLVVGPADDPDVVARMRELGWSVALERRLEVPAAFEIYSIAR